MMIAGPATFVPAAMASRSKTGMDFHFPANTAFTSATGSGPTLSLDLGRLSTRVSAPLIASTETESIREIYGETPEVVSVKPNIGHTMSASAALSVVLLCRMFREGVRLGTTTLRAPDPELPRRARQQNIG